jgi:hypothetical protein
MPKGGCEPRIVFCKLVPKRTVTENLPHWTTGGLGCLPLAARVGDWGRGKAGRAKREAERRCKKAQKGASARDEQSLAVFRGGVRLRGKRKPASLGDRGGCSAGIEAHQATRKGTKIRVCQGGTVPDKLISPSICNC